MRWQCSTSRSPTAPPRSTRSRRPAERCSRVGADVADEASVRAAVKRVANEVGAPTVLINNAGITGDNLLFKMTVEDWDAVM
jgi:NAD(P)-dependent dehydrogenase (short-subunit alcohol dehydrogenase family)